MAKAGFERTEPYCNTGTIGHVDHGKTTLTAAITKVLHDKYPDLNGLSPFDSIDEAPEKHQRDITISIARVKYQTEERRHAHVNYPGHADHVKNMIAGAVQMDSMVLVVAAINGPMAQIHEHILFARQVGVSAIVVALNKCDMIAEEDADLIDPVEMGPHETLSAQESDGDNLPIVRVATFPALSGNERWAGTIPEFMDAVNECIPQPKHDTEKSFLMLVENVFTITGHGTVITGRIERGIVKTGDTVDLVGTRSEKQTTTVTDVEMFRKILDEDRADENVGLPLHSTKKEGVERGMVAIKPGSTIPHTGLEATAYVLNEEEDGRHKPFFSDCSPQLCFHTTDITGAAQLSKDEEMIIPDDSTDMTAHLSKPIVMEGSLKLTIREGGRTIDAGKVTKIIK